MPGRDGPDGDTPGRSSLPAPRAREGRGRWNAVRPGWGRGSLAPIVSTPRTMALASLLFYGSGALVGALVTLFPSQRPSTLMLTRFLLVVPLVAGVSLVVARDRVPPWLYHVFNVSGTALVTLLVWLSGGGGPAVALAVLYVFVPLNSFLFFSIRTAVVYQVSGTLAMLACWWPLNRLPPEVVLALTVVNAVAAVVVSWCVNLVARADTDVVTGLPARRAVGRSVDDALALASETGRPFILAHLDVDHFKAVNEAGGQSAGDELLREVARRWEELLPEGAMLGCYGADEFAVLLPDMSMGAAVSILEGLRAALPAGRTASVGFGEWEPGDTASMLSSRAASALMQAKHAGRDCLFPRPGTVVGVGELRRAIERGELVVHFQPQVAMRGLTDRTREDVADRTTWQDLVVGAEALVRWAHPERGLLAPDAFVPLAEESGLIIGLGRYVLREACRQAVEAQREGRYLGEVAANVSGRELEQPDYVETVLAVLAETGLEPSRLVLEVTESSLAADESLAMVALHALRSRGIRIAIDDFGTGYSTLSRLGHLPVDIVKIDRAFVRRISTGDPAPVIAAITALADALGLSTVAEGVENAEQALVLAGHGVEQGQGWLFGRPVPLERLGLPPGPVIPPQRRPAGSEAAAPVA